MASAGPTFESLPAKLAATHLDRLKADLADEADSTGYHPSASEDDDFLHSDSGKSSRQHSIKIGSTTASNQMSKSRVSLASSNVDAASFASNTKASPSPSLILSPAPSTSGFPSTSNWPSSHYTGSRSASASRSAFNPVQSKTSLYRRQASGSSTPSYDYGDEIHPTNNGNATAGGGSSLSRAKSISSVSSVNSTSSMEAAPFRAAPLGNFRVGFGGFMNSAQLQHDRFNAATPISPNNQSQSATTNTDTSTRQESEDELPQGKETTTAKAKVMPKAPNNEWQYRNAPGLPRLHSGTSAEKVEELQDPPIGNSEINNAMQIANQRSRPSIRSKLVKRAGKLGLKPLTTVNITDVGQANIDGRGEEISQSQIMQDIASRGKGFLSPSASSQFSILNSEIGDSIRPTSSVTNAPLIVPKNPPGPPFSGPPPSPGLVGPSSGNLPIIPLAKVSPQEQSAAAAAATRPMATESNPFDIVANTESNHKTSLDVTSAARHTSIGSGLSTVLGAVLGSNRNSNSSFNRPASVGSHNSRSSPSLTPAQIIQIEARAGTATVPSEPSGASPGPDADNESLPPTDLPSSSKRSVKSIASRGISNTKGNSSPSKVQRPGLLRAITSESIGRLSHSSNHSESPKEESFEHAQDTENTIGKQRQSSQSSLTPLKLEIPQLNNTIGETSLTSNSSTTSQTIIGIPTSAKIHSSRSDAPNESVNSMTLGSQQPVIFSEAKQSAGFHPASPSVTAGQLTPVIERPRGNSSLTTNRTARTRNDFYFGETIGEGSYSTVVEAWDILPLREKGLSIPTQSQGGANNAMEAVAGKSVRKLSKEHMQDAKIYAVKILDKIHILKEKKQKYVNVEKEALSLLTRHPGVITLYWTFQDRDSLYFVLELAPNGELLNSIKKLGSFSENCTRYYAAQLLDTIEAMHRVGVLHRDIKPENILLDSNMRMRITDFGSAKIIKASEAKNDSMTKKRSSSFVGTAEYVSPELLTDKQVSEASDYWAFACIIYQMIAGRPPFKGASEYQTFQKIMSRDFSFQEGFPNDAKDLVEQLLNLDPDKRPKGKEIRAHAFFKEVHWSSIWTVDAPNLDSGLYKRPATAQQESLATMESIGTSYESAGDGIESESICESKEDENSRILKSDQTSQDHQNDGGEYADDDESSFSDIQSASFRKRGFSAGANTAERMLSQIGSGTRKSGNNLLNKVTAGIASLDKSEGSNSSTRLNRLATTSSTGNRNTNALDVDEIIASATASWAALLLPQESLLYACPVLHKTGASLLRTSNKKRQLLLTDFPRLLCVKETNDQLKVKSEVLLGIPKVLLSPADKRQLLFRRASASTQHSGASSEDDEDVQGIVNISMRRQSSAGPLLSYNKDLKSVKHHINGSTYYANSNDPSNDASVNTNETEFLRPSSTIDVTQMSPNVMTSVESKSARLFVVHTPSRTYQYEDPLGGAVQWVKRINSAARQHAATIESV